MRTERAKSGRAARLAYDLTGSRLGTPESLAKSLDTSIARLFLAFVSIGFSRLTGHDDLSLGFALHNRITPKLKNTIGLFAHNLPLRIEIDRKESFAGTVKRLAIRLDEDRIHSRFPAAELAQKLHLARQGHGLYDVLVNYIAPQNALISAMQRPECGTFLPDFFFPGP